MRLPYSSQASGFTLIELLVTVAIMMTVLGGAIAGYIQFNQRQTVLEAAKRVQAMLKSARVKAQVRDTPAGCSTQDGSQSLYGYQVVINSNSSQLFAWCGGSQATATQYAPAADTFTLPAGVTASQSHTVIYYTLHGGTNLVADREVVISNGSQTYRFAVTTSGEIREGCWGDDACN